MTEAQQEVAGTGRTAYGAGERLRLASGTLPAPNPAPAPAG